MLLRLCQGQGCVVVSCHWGVKAGVLNTTTERELIVMETLSNYFLLFMHYPKREYFSAAVKTYEIHAY